VRPWNYARWNRYVAIRDKRHEIVSDHIIAFLIQIGMPVRERFHGVSPGHDHDQARSVS
jgi:hypothetical protein